MPRRTNPHHDANGQQPLVDDLRIELVDLGSDLPISVAELDALEQLLGSDLRQLLR